MPVRRHFAVRPITAFLVFVSFASPQKIEFAAVSKDVIETRLHQTPEGNAQREAALKKLFEEAGCTGDRLREQAVRGDKVPNLVCTLAGTTERMILVGAHTDHVGPGEGVVDNWSGSSLLASFYQSLRDQPRLHTFVFVGFTGEEKGLLGSKFYAGHMTNEERRRTSAMINLDSLGLAGTAVWLSRADKSLVAAAARTASSMNLPLVYTNVEKVGTTDSESFAALKIPRITFHSVTQETWRIINGPKDTWQAVHLDQYYESYRLIAAYLAVLDATLDATPVGGAAGGDGDHGRGPN